MVATLAVPNGLAMPKPTVDAQASGNYSPETVGHPRPMTTNADEHSAAVKAYLRAAWVLAAEVSGMNVTTTMAGGGPVRDGCSRRSQSCFGTRPIWRVIGGILVESSYSFAALDNAGREITEGVYRPAIPANVVSNAWAFVETLAGPRERAAFLAQNAEGQTRCRGYPRQREDCSYIGWYHGPFQALAVYSTVVPSPRGRKVQILRFEENGARVRLTEEASTEAD
jgi:hypothetical protein